MKEIRRYAASIFQHDLDEMKAYPTYLQSLGLMIIWFLCTVLTTLLLVPIRGLQRPVFLMVAYALSMALTILIGIFLRGSGQFDNKRFSWQLLPLSIVLITCVQIILDPLTEFIPVSDVMRQLLKGMVEDPLPYFFMAVLAAPVLEELLFRGIILQGYLSNYKPLPAVLVSAALFGVIHGNLLQGAGAFILGAIIGWLFYRTRSILFAILLHFINNGFAFVATQLSDPQELELTLFETINNAPVYFAIYVGSLVIGSITVWQIHKMLRSSTDAT